MSIVQYAALSRSEKIGLQSEAQVIARRAAEENREHELWGEHRDLFMLLRYGRSDFAQMVSLWHERSTLLGVVAKLPKAQSALADAKKKLQAGEDLQQQIETLQKKYGVLQQAVSDAEQKLGQIAAARTRLRGIAPRWEKENFERTKVDLQAKHSQDTLDLRNRLDFARRVSRIELSRHLNEPIETAERLGIKVTVSGSSGERKIDTAKWKRAAEALIETIPVMEAELKQAEASLAEKIAAAERILEGEAFEST